MKGGRFDNLILGLLIALFVAFGFFLFLSVSPSKNLSNTVPTVTNVERQPINGIVGVPFTLGNIEYTVLTVDDKGSKYGFDTTTGKFIVLTIQARNISKEESGVSKIYLKDNQGRKYERSRLVAETNSKLNQYGHYSNFTGIPASFSETYNAVFELASDSNGLELVFPSLEGYEVAKIPLGP